MKILVCVKRVLDYNIKAVVKSDNSGIDLQNCKMSINPFDEIAVEEVVKLQEQNIAKESVVVSIGPQEATETIRASLALGIHRGILVKTEETFSSLNIAKILQKIVIKEQPNLVIMGKQAIDDDANQTGQMLSALLGWAQGTFASKIEFKNEKVIVTREIDTGLEELECSMPAVLTVDLRLNTPRYAKLPNIIRAKQKPLETIELGSLNLNIKTNHKIIKIEEPKPRVAGKIVDSVPELIDLYQSQQITTTIFLPILFV